MRTLKETAKKHLHDRESLGHDKQLQKKVCET